MFYSILYQTVVVQVVFLLLNTNVQIANEVQINDEYFTCHVNNRMLAHFYYQDFTWELSMCIMRKIF